MCVYKLQKNAAFNCAISTRGKALLLDVNDQGAGRTPCNMGDEGGDGCYNL